MRKVLPRSSSTLAKAHGGAANAGNGHLGSGVAPQDGFKAFVTKMAFPDGIPVDVSQTGLRRTWHDLVWQPSAEKLKRCNVQLWAWLLAPDNYFLLRPALGTDGKSTRKAVVGQTPRAWPGMYRGQGPTDYKDPLYYAEMVLSTPMMLCWWDGSERKWEEAVVPNACVLRYVTEAALQESFLKSSLPDSMWDFTREHPDKPGELIYGVPALVDVLNGKQAAPTPEFEF